ncbi:hypothetical protein L1987_11899 [Smallanthus sonchifolius]|uniref:Uncharacterized protein n=1 Tax=Smallanthus sonchifolius TaxID=185202 RepID=A0ACB9JEE7_9ASTR|nr:hypothetical protein L1987_11899 [Smallanthus sonchifolius]
MNDKLSRLTESIMHHPLSTRIYPAIVFDLELNYLVSKRNNKRIFYDRSRDPNTSNRFNIHLHHPLPFASYCITF